MKILINLSVIAIIFIAYAQGAKILGFFGTPGKSHMIISDSLMRKLAERGHNVTVMSGFPPSGNVPKTYRHINVPLDMQQYEPIAKNLLQDAESNRYDFSRMLSFFSIVQARNEEFLNHPEFQRMKREETFDLVIFNWFGNDYQIGVASHFQCPAVYIFLQRSNAASRKYSGSSSQVSYVPGTFATIQPTMNFFDRVGNFLKSGLEYLIFQAIDEFYMKPVYEKHFPPSTYPTYAEAKLNVSLALNSYHFSQGVNEAHLAASVDVGGMHIDPKSAPLPKDIKEFLDDAKDGAIFFSLGSNARSSHLSADRRDAILRVLSKLKQRILWKYEDDTLPYVPANIMISKWFPQSDILAHPNTRLFISHGGFGSVTESKYHGIPILGVPIYGDQPGNLQQGVKEGWIRILALSEFTEIRFANDLNEMLTNSSYRQTVQEMSKLYRDRPAHPMDTAIFWVEYILRHNGAKHMQSPAVHLNFFQYYSLDVIALLAMIVYLIIRIAKMIVLLLWRQFRKLFSRSNEKKKTGGGGGGSGGSRKSKKE